MCVITEETGIEKKRKGEERREVVKRKYIKTFTYLQIHTNTRKHIHKYKHKHSHTHNYIPFPTQTPTLTHQPFPASPWHTKESHWLIAGWMVAISWEGLVQIYYTMVNSAARIIIFTHITIITDIHHTPARNPTYPGIPDSRAVCSEI